MNKIRQDIVLSSSVSDLTSIVPEVCTRKGRNEWYTVREQMRVEEDDYSMEEACSKISPLPGIAITCGLAKDFNCERGVNVSKRGAQSCITSHHEPSFFDSSMLNKVVKILI